MNVMKVVPVAPNYINRIYISIQNYIFQNKLQVITIRSSRVGSNIVGLDNTPLCNTNHPYISQGKSCEIVAANNHAWLKVTLL